jgi:hypothetical protein
MARPKGSGPTAGSFKDGVSGNPSGRPKENNEVKALAAEHTVEAIKKIYHLMGYAEEEETQLKAAIYLIERAWGRPAQSLKNEDGESFSVKIGGFKRGSSDE